MKPTNRRLPLADLRAHPHNYNRHPPKQVKRIAASLRKFGQVRSIVVWQNTILAGHGVVEAARSMGWFDIAADVLPDEYPEHLALAYVAADNELARLGDPDQAALAAIIEQSRAIDAELLEAIGYDDAELAKLVRETGLDKNELQDAEPQVDRAEELRQKWGVESGQLWQLGEHRLICGDCTDAAVVERIMGEERTQSLFFDPPWDLNMSPVTGFDSALVFGDGSTLGNIVSGYGAPTWLFVWDCVSSWFTPNRPLRRMKLCAWYGTISDYDSDGWHYGDSGEQRTVWNTRGEYIFVPDPRGKHLSDVYSEPITKLHSNGEHSHSKPLDWISLLIANCTRGDVYDPFLGSGTTLIACEQLKRRCRAVEIAPGYVAVALERWATATGKTPTLIR